jgi:putative two-component system response regulator
MQRRIYVADDIPTNVDLIEDIFGGDTNLVIKKAQDGKELLGLIEREGFPDLILLDLMMPVMNGFDVLNRLKESREKNYFPIIVISALSDQQNIVNALSLGADDYVTKPFFMGELKTRVYNMLKLKEHDELLNRSLDIMQGNLLEKIKMLEYTQLEVIIRLGKAAEFRDNETGKHIERIADFVEIMVQEIEMSREEKVMMKYASPMHDVGKIGIPDNILLKPGKLTDDEFKIIKFHTIIGSKILSGTTISILELAREIAVSHHERWDGSGYPLKLKGTDIPLSGMIVSVTDVFDALTSERVYKAAWPIEKALDYIKEQREKQFAPDVVDAFLKVVNKIIKIKEAKADPPAAKSMIQQIIDGDYTIEELIERWR